MPLPLFHLVEQFRELDRRRASGLSLGEAARLRGLMAAISERLSYPRSAPDRREFLRVERAVTVRFEHDGAPGTGMAIDFGGGGLCLLGDFGLAVGHELHIQSLSVAQASYELDVRAAVVWRSPPPVPPEAGIAFRFRSDADRDRVNEVFYRILDLVVRAAESEAHSVG
jgi:hypothetical protein